MNTTGLAQALMEAMAAGPWWAWPVSLVTTLLTLAAAVWLARRALKGLASTVREAVTAAALGERERREKIAAFLRAQAMTLLFVAVVGIVVGLSAQTMVAWLMEIGMSRLWARLGFVAFDGMAMMLALTLWQRLRRDEATGMIRPALWGIVAASSFFCSQHAPEGNAPAAVAYALFPVIAALGLEFLLQEQRRDRTWLKEQAGEQERRRLALVRWLHPVERVQVHLEMARDEALGAEEATRLVRERTAHRREEATLERVRATMWRLRHDQAATVRAPGWLRPVLERRERVAEARAQAAVAAADLASSPDRVAGVLRELQMMAMASTIASLDYSSPAQARQALARLISVESLGPIAALPPAPDRSQEPTERTSEQSAPADGPSDAGPSEDEASAPTPEADTAPPALAGAPESESAHDPVDLSDDALARVLSDWTPDTLTPPDLGSERQRSGERSRAQAPRKRRTAPGGTSSERRERALELWLSDRSLSGAELARMVGASPATGSRWRREFERAHGASGERGPQSDDDSER